MADNLFSLRVLSPLGTVFEGTAKSARLPTAEGEIMVLANHMPLVCVLVDGEMSVDTGQKVVSIAIAGGFLDTSTAAPGGIPGSGAVVLSDFAAESDSIEVARAEAAKARAEDLLKEKKDRADVLMVERDLQRAILQLKIAEKTRKRRTGAPNA